MIATGAFGVRYLFNEYLFNDSNKLAFRCIGFSNCFFDALLLGFLTSLKMMRGRWPRPRHRTR
jgi:hypothetical protein